jgi:polyisoprenoid-binding protein YceI
MKTIQLTLALLAITLTTQAQTYALDRSHSKLGFGITHLMISEVEGQFKTFDVKLAAKKEDLSDASIEVTADINSIDTDDDKRDEHLKAADFFDAPNFPTLTFKSTSYKKDGTDKYKYVLTGNLTMHGVTKLVTLEVIYNGSAVHPYTKKTILGFKIKGIIKRSDFSISAATPSAVLSDEINLNANAEFIKD